MNQPDSVAPPPIPTASPHRPAVPPRRHYSPVVNFWIDVAIAVASMLALGLFAGLGWGLYSGFQVGMQAAASGGDAPDVAVLGEPGALAQILMAVFMTAGTAAILYFIRGRATPVERRASLAAASRPATWGIALGAGLAIFLGSTVLTWLAGLMHVEPAPTNLPLMQDAKEAFPVFLVIFAVMLAPFYEEVLFRRCLFGRLWRGGRPVLGMALSAIAFALIHEVPGLSGNGPLEILLLWTVYGGMGIVFAWVYQRTGTLLAPIIAHGVNNGIAITALFLGFSG